MKQSPDPLPPPTEPALTTNLSDIELLPHLQRPLQVATFRVHTEVVERAVKAVTKAASAVVGDD